MLEKAKRALLNTKSIWGSQVRLGDDLNKKKGVLAAKYDFAVQGGSVGAKNLLVDLKETWNLAKLPDKAVITNVVIDIVTAFTSTGGTGTIALSAQGAGDLLAAVDADTLSNRVQGIPVNTVASSIKLTAERTIQLTVAVAALLTGKAVVFVEYYISE